jgi:hypothetical protein
MSDAKIAVSTAGTVTAQLESPPLIEAKVGQTDLEVRQIIGVVASGTQVDVFDGGEVEFKLHDGIVKPFVKGATAGELAFEKDTIGLGLHVYGAVGVEVDVSKHLALDFEGGGAADINTAKSSAGAYAGATIKVKY